MSLSVAVLLLALAVAPAAAEDTQVFDLGTQAPVAGNKTWRDLLGLLFPDLRQEPGHDGKAGDFIHGKVDIRPIDKEAFDDYCPDTPLRIEYINFKQVEIDGQMRLIVAITTDGDACFGALALFSNQFEARLLDVVNIQQDAHYGYNDDFVRSLGAGARLVIADSFHMTTDSSPTNYVLVLATADRLSLIGNVIAEGEWDCEHHRGISERPYVAVAPDYGPFDRITGYIKRTVRRVGDDCRTPTGKPTFTISRTDWRWNAAKKAYGRVSP